MRRSKFLSAIGGIVIAIVFIAIISCIAVLCYGSANDMTFVEVWKSFFLSLKGAVVK